MSIATVLLMGAGVASYLYQHNTGMALFDLAILAANGYNTCKGVRSWRNTNRDIRQMTDEGEEV